MFLLSINKILDDISGITKNIFFLFLILSSLGVDSCNKSIHQRKVGFFLSANSKSPKFDRNTFQAKKVHFMPPFHIQSKFIYINDLAKKKLLCCVFSQVGSLATNLSTRKKSCVFLPVNSKK